MEFDKKIANGMAAAMKKRVVDDVIAHSGKGVHPRIFLGAADFDRIRTSHDEVYVHGREHVLKRADAYLDAPLLVYHIPDGIRLLQVSRDTLDRSLYLGMAYRLTGDEKYAERLWRELENAACYKDWNPYHHLDVGEMCNALGIGYDWIYDYLSKEQRAVLCAAIVRNGFNTTMDDYLDRERVRSYRWYQDEPGDNWKFVCNGGATVAALAICDEEGVDRRLVEDVLGYAFESTYCAVREMYLPDGSYAEGFAYWNYASDYLAYYVSALKSAAGTDYGLADYDPVRKSAYYVKMMCANSFNAFNFGDAYEFFACAEVFLFIGKNYGEEKIITMRADEIRKNPEIVRVRDILWYIPTPSFGLEEMPLGFGSVGGDNAAIRAGFGEDDLYAAIHFGDNNAYHAHADMGTFVIEWKRRRFICDLGQDNYNVKGDYRLTYRYRAEGHNTLVINPGEGADQERYSVVHVDAFSDGTQGEPYAIADMSDTYPGRRVKRGIRLTEDKRWIVVRDELKLKKGDTGLWFAHTKGKITLSEERSSAVIELDGEQMLVCLLVGGTGELEVMPCELMHDGHNQEGQYNNSEYSKLALRFDDRETEIAVAFCPIIDGEAPEYLPLNKSLFEW